MKNIQPEEIGFDFDGVIANTGETFVRIATEQHGYNFKLTDITHFDIENCINMPMEVAYDIFMEIMKNSISTGVTPMPGAVERINQITTNHRVTVITARSMMEPVKDWFDHHFKNGINDKITLIAMGDHNDKVRYAREHKLKYFVDDRAETCMQFAKEDFKPIVFDQPWNQGQHNLPVVSNWHDIRAMLALNGE